jgi:putative transposase
LANDKISTLIVRMATENRGWGYSGIQGALKNLDHRVARSTVAKVLREHGIPPAPGRPSSWRTFLRAHWGAIAGADFFTTEVWTPRGLVAYYTLFVLDLKSRRVRVVGSTPNPDSAFMVQAARRLTDAVDGFLVGHRVLICDRDDKWTREFRCLLEGAGVRVVLTPLPGAECQRSRGTVRAVDSRGVSGPAHLVRGTTPNPGGRRVRGALSWERNHQGLGNRLVAPEIRARQHPH